MKAYYNENNPKAATWLKQLIVNGDITKGCGNAIQAQVATAFITAAMNSL